MPNHSSRSGLFARLTRKQLAIGGAVAVVIIGAVVGIAVSGGSSKPPSNPAASKNGTTPAVASDRCPLTDEPAPGGAVPQRPALMVKIGNEPEGARPQSGLNEADIVFDTPAEGFIMRYIAVYQCNNASAIGPTRSVRWVDWHIARMFLSPILTFAGGINPDVDTVLATKWIHPADLLTAQASAGTRITSRVAPDNLYTSTSSLYGLYSKDVAAPPPVFTYTSSLPSKATTAASLGINFSAGTDVLWKWDASANQWLHTYAGATDVDTLTNQPVTTTNIVVMDVNYTFGPNIESPGGSGDVQSVTTGTGPGYVLRNGKSIAVTWHRKDPVSGLSFTDSSGQAVGLAPGRTWVELVPITTVRAGGMHITS